MILKEIQAILEKEEFTCSLFLADEKHPVNRLLVFLGLDPQKRERILEMMVGQQPSPTFILAEKTPPLARIQFWVELPFKVEDMNSGQVGSLLLFLNQFMDLPGFELDELHGKVIYRYVWIIKPELIDSSLIMSIIGAIMLNLSLFTETIESLANGKTSFNDLLSKIVKLADRSKNR